MRRPEALRTPVPASPCEVFRCALAPICRREVLACEAFEYYSLTSEVIPPWRRRPRTGRRPMNPPPERIGIQPTREVYERAFPAKDVDE